MFLKRIIVESRYLLEKPEQDGSLKAHTKDRLMNSGCITAHLRRTEIVGLNLAMRHELQVSYDFESASNNVVQDASPTDRDGTIVGPVIVQGIGSNALQFDGIDDYVQASASLNPGKQI